MCIWLTTAGAVNLFGGGLVHGLRGFPGRLLSVLPSGLPFLEG